MGLLCGILLLGVPRSGTAGVVKGSGSGLPLPRFVSLRSDEVKLRTGPGVQYPIEWIYTRRSYPVEVIAEFDTWRRIRDWEGGEGWVHQSMLIGRRTFANLSQIRDLRTSPGEEASVIARVEPGLVGDLLQCPTNTPQYCRVEVQNYVGWLKRGDFWGVQRDEFIP
ncbi:MAG: hypothetical protein FD149_664 [Rhodospirillaceae bacterium]|nr:MAG: hypothetical protein FD149_664 [Rhodospirillaceae bacterium]